MSGTFELHLDLPAEVHEERAIGDAEHLDPVEFADDVGDAVEMVLVRRGDGDVPHLVVWLDADDVDGAERSARPADRLRDARKRSG